MHDMDNLPENYIFPFEVYYMPITKAEIDIFRDFTLNVVPDKEYFVTAIEATYKIDKKKRTLRIVERNYGVSDAIENQILSNRFIDFQVMKLCKTAMYSGFRVFLESKFSN